MPDTSYHSWTMPTVDGSTDVWGQELNDMFDNEIDAVVERRGTLANRPGAANVPSGAKYLVTSGSEVGTVYVESGGSWTELGRFARTLKRGQLGTLATNLDSDDFTISAVATSETTPLAPPVVTTRTAINEDYRYNAVDWMRDWDESAGELNVIVTVNWDVKPSVDLDLDYVVYSR